MKKFLLLFSLILGSTFSFGQTFDIENLSYANMYVHLYEVDAGCNVTTINVFCPAGQTTTVTLTNASSVIEFAFVSDLPLALANPSCYYIKVQLPSASCVSGYPTIDSGAPCPSFGTITSDFTQTTMLGVPYLLIN